MEVKEVNSLPSETFFNLKKQKQNRVIKAAVNEFAQNGYTKGSITRIVEDAEIAKGSYYQYFEGKKDLFIYLIKLALEKKDEYLSQELKDDIDQDFFSYWRNFNIANLKFASKNPQLAKISVEQLKLPSIDKIDFLIKGYKEEQKSVFEKLLKKAIRNNVIRKDIESKYLIDLVYKINYFILEYFFEYKEKKKFNQFIDIIDKIIYIVGDGIKEKEVK